MIMTPKLIVKLKFGFGIMSQLETPRKLPIFFLSICLVLCCQLCELKIVLTIGSFLKVGLVLLVGLLHHGHQTSHVL
jgi:hypothetical protein